MGQFTQVLVGPIRGVGHCLAGLEQGGDGGSCFGIELSLREPADDAVAQRTPRREPAA